MNWAFVIPRIVAVDVRRLKRCVVGSAAAPAASEDAPSSECPAPDVVREGADNDARGAPCSPENLPRHHHRYQARGEGFHQQLRRGTA